MYGGGLRLFGYCKYAGTARDLDMVVTRHDGVRINDTCGQYGRQEIQGH